MAHGKQRKGFGNGNGAPEGNPPGNDKGNLTATENDDHIKGTGDGDLIDGLGGDDLIIGFGGDDDIDGGTGEDDISGSAGDDTVSGGSVLEELLDESGEPVLDGDGNPILVEVSDGEADSIVAEEDALANGTDAVNFYDAPVEGDDGLEAIDILDLSGVAFDFSSALVDLDSPGVVTEAELAAFVSYDATTGELSVDLDGDGADDEGDGVLFVVSTDAGGSFAETVAVELNDGIVFL